MGWYGGYAPYVPVAQRRAQAQRKMEKLKKQGKKISPVTIAGRTIAKSFWGKSWCENLARYSDYENRLPRGRTYVRNGSVVDLQVRRGEVTAMVSGSSIYNINVEIAPVANDRWSSICEDCSGSVGSLVELLQGKLSKSVMERVCRKGDGLFPAPHEIKLSCSCPDWADMCKHVAAAMYGIGARLDEKPDLLFKLRAVDENELIAKAGRSLPIADAAPKSTRVMAGDDIGAMFGLDMGESESNVRKIRQPEKIRAISTTLKKKPASIRAVKRKLAKIKAGKKTAANSLQITVIPPPSRAHGKSVLYMQPKRKFANAKISDSKNKTLKAPVRSKTDSRKM